MRKKRIILLSICGILATSLTAAFLFPVKARSMELTVPLFHHHSEACLGEVLRRQETDTPGTMGRTYEDVCPICGGVVHGYGFRAECSCGQTWYHEGYACYNSPYGSNPGGGCTYYSPVSYDTMHDHLSIENVCGLEEDSLMGEVIIEISTTDPVSELTLSATYHGELAEPVMNWEEGPKEEDAPETEEEEGAKTAGESEGDGTETEEKEEEDGAETDGESEGDGMETEEEKEEVPEKLGSSITVVKNGIYTLTTEYEEDGIGYTVKKSVKIGNIVKPEPPAPEEPAKEAPADVPQDPVAEQEEIPEEVLPEEPKHPTKVSPAVMVKEPEPEEEVKEEPNIPKPEPVKVEVSEEKTSETPKGTVEEKRNPVQWFADLPVPVKVTATVGASTLVGAFLLGYGWFILFRTAMVMWVDEDGRNHFLGRALIRKKSHAFAIELRKKILLKARFDEFIIRLPGLFAALYHFQPVNLSLENRTYSLHVEREIRIGPQG